MKKLKMLVVGLITVGVFIFGSMNIKEFDQIDLAGPHGELFKIFDTKDFDLY